VSICVKTRSKHKTPSMKPTDSDKGHRGTVKRFLTVPSVSGQQLTLVAIIMSPRPRQTKLPGGVAGQDRLGRKQIGPSPGRSAYVSLVERTGHKGSQIHPWGPSIHWREKSDLSLRSMNKSLERESNFMLYFEGDTAGLTS